MLARTQISPQGMVPTPLTTVFRPRSCPALQAFEPVSPF